MDTRLRIAPSLLAADFARLGDEVRRAEAAGADVLHLDVMDGHFVPNLTFGPALVKALRPLTRLEFDVHLMLSRPEDFFEPFARAGADGITFHWEVHPEPEAMLARLAALGVKRGLSINPDCPVANLAGHVGSVDRLLLMSVFPGFGGQSFIAASLARLAEARALLEREGRPGAELQVDGGLTVDNAAAVRAAGATNLVAGTALFGAPDMAAAVRRMRGEAAG